MIPHIPDADLVYVVFILAVLTFVAAMAASALIEALPRGRHQKGTPR